MSFEVFMQCSDRGQPSGVAAEAVRGAFTHFADNSEPDYWRLRYDELNSCDVLVTRFKGQPDQITALAVHRPCEDRRLWDSLYRVLKLGRWVLYFPAEEPPIVVADRSHAEHLPPEMRKALGPVRVVRSGKEIQRIIRNS
jgi:hypothetical protein